MLIKFIKDNKYNIFLGVMLFISLLLCIFTLSKKMISGMPIKLYCFSLMTAALFIVGLIFGFRYLIRKETKIERIFLYLGTVMGILFLLLSPFFTGSDEHNHFYRIYEITEGKIKTPTNNYVGSVMPSSLSKMFALNSTLGMNRNTTIKYSSIKKMMKIKLNKKKVSQYGTSNDNYYANTALYSPVSYIPHVIGVAIGKTFNLRPYFIGMLGRLFNLIFYLALGYIALKIIPKYKLFFLAILLSPNMMQLATTLSADAWTNIIVLLIISYVYRIYDSKKTIEIKDEIILFILCLIISLSKIVYLPIIGVLLLIKEKQFKKDKKEKVLYISIVFLICSAISLFWIMGTKEIFGIAYDNSHYQKTYILGHLFQYGLVIINTFFKHGLYYIECLFAGTMMYHAQLYLPPVISFAYVFLVIICFMDEKKKNTFTKGKRLGVMLLGIIIIGLISTAEYLQCTAQFFGVAYSTIEGIQGRYFIPIILLFPFMLNIDRWDINFDSNLAINSILAFNIITYFYMIMQFAI